MTEDLLILEGSLRRLGETLTSWNWNSFWENALSTLAGAFVAFGGLVYIFYREAKAKKEERFISAVGDVFESVSKHAKDLKTAWNDEKKSYMRVVLHPDDFAVLSAIAKARFLSARKCDSDVMDAVRDLVIQSRSLDLYIRIAVLTDIWPTLINWRSGGKASEAVARLQSNVEWYKKDIETYFDGKIWTNRRKDTNFSVGGSGSKQEAEEFGAAEAERLGVEHITLVDAAAESPEASPAK